MGFPLKNSIIIANLQATHVASSFMLQNDILRMHRNKFRMPNKNGVADSLGRKWLDWLGTLGGVVFYLSLQKFLWFHDIDWLIPMVITASKHQKTFKIQGLFVDSQGCVVGSSRDRYTT